MEENLGSRGSPGGPSPWEELTDGKKTTRHSLTFPMTSPLWKCIVFCREQSFLSGRDELADRGLHAPALILPVVGLAS